MKESFMQGNAACAEGAIAAGCRFFAGYPITPSSEIAEYLAARLSKLGGHFIQMEDELGSISACIGASWCGLKAMTATSGPGFSLMQEGMGYAVMTETPVVIVNVQRSGPSTGQATKLGQGDVMQCRYGSHGDYALITVAPSSAQEFYELTMHAFNLAELYRVPVVVLADEHVGHLREKAIIKPGRVVSRRKARGKNFFGTEGKITPMPTFGDGLAVHVTGSTHTPDGLRDVTTPAVHEQRVRHFIQKIEKHRVRIENWEERWVEDAEILVVSFGSTARPTFGGVKKAREKNIRAGFFRPITLWPSPEPRLRELAGEIDKILLVEHSLTGYKPEIERIVDKEILHFPKVGGEVHTSDEVLEFLRKVKE